MTASNEPAGTQPIRADVAIVGAGPAGTAAAAHLGKLGIRDVVLLDKHDFPRDKTCGSGISPKGIAALRELGVWGDIEPHSVRITGIRLVTPQGHESYQSAGDAVEAVVCQRRTLDHLILKRALATGTRFFPHFVAEKLIERDGRIQGVRAKDGREVHARYTVIAGGTHCRLVPERRPRKLIQAIMGWWDGVPFRTGHVEMIFDPEIAPYYGWLFPESETRVNIGITYEDPESKRNARDVFSRFLEKHYAPRLRAATQVGPWKGHPIAYSYRIEGLTSPGRVVIGESGLLTHPATAEGIYQGMRSGMIAAEALRDILLYGHAEDAALAQYERQVKETFQASFLGGGLFRALVRTPVLDWAVKVSEKPLVQSAAAKVLAAL